MFQIIFMMSKTHHKFIQITMILVLLIYQVKHYMIILKKKYNSDSIDIHYNNIMIDVGSKDNLSIVKSNIENNISNAIAVTNIEDTASYTTYQGEIDEGKTYIGVFFRIIYIYCYVISSNYDDENC